MARGPRVRAILTRLGAPQRSDVELDERRAEEYRRHHHQRLASRPTDAGRHALRWSTRTIRAEPFQERPIPKRSSTYKRGEIKYEMKKEIRAKRKHKKKQH